MTRLLSGILLVALLAAPTFAAAETVKDHPDKQLAANVVEVVALINRGDPAELLAYVETRYAKEMLTGMTPESTARFLMGVHESKSPLDLCCYQISDRVPEKMAIAILRDAKHDIWTSLQIRFDADDKVNSFMIVPAKPPSGFVDLKKLDDAGLASEFDAYLTGLLEEDKFSGTVLIAHDGKPVFAKAYGLANREHEIPNQLDTRFSLGSMNKMFTAVAIAQLAEQGKLSFDDPIGKHLPEGWVAPEIGRTVRIRQLLNHTSGLGDFLEAFIESAHYQYQTLDDYKKIVAPETLAFEPGSKWAYSNTGFLLLGVIVSNVSGQDYYDYLREKIYAPAGMKDTDSYDFTRVVPKLADGYYKDEGQWRKNTLMRASRGTSA